MGIDLLVVFSTVEFLLKIELIGLLLYSDANLFDFWD